MNTLRSLSITMVCCLAAACGLQAQMAAGSVYTQLPDTLAILTPKQSPAPRINGPKIFGVRPGHPILFTIPATGTRPISFSAEKLPAGVQLDKNTGRLSGVIDKAGEYNLVLHAKNKAGNNTRNLKLIVGELLSLTPPM